MDSITPKEIMMPVLVLWDGCADCDRLDILVKSTKLYADGEEAGTINELRCTSVYECKKWANHVLKIMSKEE